MGMGVPEFGRANGLIRGAPLRNSQGLTKLLHGTKLVSSHEIVTPHPQSGHFFRAVAKLGHPDGLADAFWPQDHPLGDVACQVRVLA